MHRHLSQGGNGERSEGMEGFQLKARLNKYINHRKFVLDCIAEQVLPKFAPKQLKEDTHPFSKTARTYLQERCRDMDYKINELKDDLRGIHIPNYLVERLKRGDREHKNTLERKLNTLCNESRWKTAGRNDLITNLSSTQLTDTQTEALSLGLKFDTGLDRKKLTEHISYNHDWKESEVERGFKQGILVCYKAFASQHHRSLPRRYIEALKTLGANGDLVITQADKGGGVIIMDRTDYDEKMLNLLNDANTYTKKHEGFNEERARDFEKKARKIMNRTERGKKLRHLLEDFPRPPKMKGLPKIHKPEIPLRPITSGIGSAPHRLAKCLAKPLSAAMGSISGTHLRNSKDLKERLLNTVFRNRKMASFDVKSLFTNVPVEGAMEAVRRVVDTFDDNDLPVSKSSFIDLIYLCVGFGAFTYNGTEYDQHRGLAMGSPLSAVMASLYMETLEEDFYKNIIDDRTTWLRYVDDIIIITPTRTNLDDIRQRLNDVNSDIQFTIEEETEGRLPFLDTTVIRTNDGPKFKVYRKMTNKDDFIHFLSAHNDRTKSGVVIGFFLRALRICSPEYLAEEVQYVTQAFMRLGYPRGMILDLKDKARRIMERNNDDNNDNNDDNDKRTNFLTVPNADVTRPLDKMLNGSSLKLAVSSGVKVGDLIKTKTDIRTNKDSVVYKIPCTQCSSAYYGETSKGLDNRLTQHKADIRHHRTTNSLVNHIDEAGHLPDWKQASTLHTGLNRKMRKAVESIYIATNENNNTRPGILAWAETAAEIVAREWRLPANQNPP